MTDILKLIRKKLILEKALDNDRSIVIKDIKFMLLHSWEVYYSSDGAEWNISEDDVLPIKPADYWTENKDVIDIIEKFVPGDSDYTFKGKFDDITEVAIIDRETHKLKMAIVFEDDGKKMACYKGFESDEDLINTLGEITEESLSQL